MSDHREIPVTGRTTTTNNRNNNNNPYVHMSPAPPSSASANRVSLFQRTDVGAVISGPNPTMEAIHDRLNHYSRSVEKATRQAEIMVDSFWNHVRMSSNPVDAAMARIVQGTRVLTNGGTDKLFQQTFGIFPGEKLLKPYACYISTASGPVIGTLYISTKRIAFCSDYPLCHHPFSLQQHNCIYYKVVVQLDEVSTVSPATNTFNPTELYIKVVKVDGYEFYFMGFISYDKAFKTLNEALQQYHSRSSERRVPLQ